MQLTVIGHSFGIFKTTFEADYTTNVTIRVFEVDMRLANRNAKLHLNEFLQIH